MQRTSSHNITELQTNEVFTFGANTAGRHGAGAAKLALKWGAKFGQGEGLAGQTYAIPTKDKNIKTLDLPSIAKYVANFIQFARQNPDLKFLVTEIGCGLAGYSPSDIAPLFKDAVEVENIHLPKSFWDVLNF